MTYKREDAPLWVRALACVLVALMVAVTLVITVALAVSVVRLLAEGLMWLISLAWVGGVAQ